MGKFVRSIPVEDASGCRFKVHEFEWWTLLRRMRRFELDTTGERVDYVDENTFAIAVTGERLCRVE